MPTTMWPVVLPVDVTAEAIPAVATLEEAIQGDIPAEVIQAVAIPVADIPVVEADAEEATLEVEVAAHTVMPMAKR